MSDISRRDALKIIGATSAAAALPGGAAAPSRAPHAGQAGGVVARSSTSDVFVPPRGNAFLDYSFDWPEPSVAFGGLLFSFRLFTRENVYAPSPAAMHVSEEGGVLTLTCDRLTWAGGRETSEGRIVARIRQDGDAIVWDAEADHAQPIKALTAVVRGLPRGKLCPGADGFTDYKDDAALFQYPHPIWNGWNFTDTIPFPCVVLDAGDSHWLVDSLDAQVRPKRWYFQPGPDGYRLELVVEEKGYRWGPHFACPPWRIARAPSNDAAFERHRASREQLLGLVPWERRTDVPDWLREVALVVSLHGTHWTGYVFNTYARMLEILEWTATQIPGRRVLVFLPAWDGRYYWNYPLYRPDARMGGAERLARLVTRGHELGFHFMPMFGANGANRNHPEFARFADALTVMPDGNTKYIDNADWDVDRTPEGWDFFMNLGAPSWRNWLSGRIAETVERFGMDAYFLDIANAYLNDGRHDMYEGTRDLVLGLRDRFPRVTVCGEYYYDAMFPFIPFYQVLGEWTHPALTDTYVRAFSHLSHPAPGRGSSGVHERGFGGFDEKTLGLNDRQIPTITVVDDTFDRYRDVMAEIIRRAKARAGIP